MDSIREGQGTPWGARRAGSLHCADAIGVYPGQHVAGHTLNANSQTVRLTAFTTKSCDLKI